MARVTLPQLPKIDLSKIEFPRVDLSKIDLPKIDMSKVKVPQLHSIDITNVDLAKLDPRKVLDAPVVKQATEAGYTAVGFAVLGFQKAQVRRREILESLKNRFNTAN